MKYFEKNFGYENGHDSVYAITLTSYNENINDLEKIVFEKVAKDTAALLKRTKSYISDLLNYSNPNFKGEIVLESIDIIGTSERSFQIKVNFYFPNDEDMINALIFNLPLIEANSNSLKASIYNPIEFKRWVY